MSNVLITGVIICMISVALSGVVSLLVSDHNSRGQSQDTAREAASNQQTQEVGQLQKSANAIDQDAQNVAIYAFRCSVKGKKWAACVFGAPAYFKLLADSDTLGAIADSTTDQRADVLARKLSGKVNALLASKTVLAGITDLGATTDAQLDLDQRCGLLIQGFS